GHGIENGVQESGFSFQYGIVLYVLFVEPVVNIMLVTENNAHQHNERQQAEKRYQRRDRFRNSSESQRPSSHRQGGSADKKHSGVGHQEEKHAVVQQYRPETGLLLLIAACQG